MPNQLPALADVAAAALAVGLLFCLRFALALRRLRAESGSSGGRMGIAWGIGEAMRFGAEREPERRHAARQLVIGDVFLATALLLYAWILLGPELSVSRLEGSPASATLEVRP